MLRRIEEFQLRGSNWKISRVKVQHVHLSKYSPLEGSSYISTPKEISNPKLGLINMQNTDDNFCFRWSHVRHLSPMKKNSVRISKNDRITASTLNYEGIVFPVSIDQIKRIEDKNNININVLGYKGRKIFYPVRVSKTSYNDTMNLLLIDDNGNNHYILIKDINRLLHSTTKDKNKKHFCLNCFHNFETEESLQQHRDVCLEVNGVQAVKLPPPGTKIRFKNHNNIVEAPFIIYADFESSLSPDRARTGLEPKTILLQEHKAISFGYKRVCSLDDRFTGKDKSYIGVDAAEVFIRVIKEEQSECNKLAKTWFYRKDPVEDDDIEDFITQTKCYICESPVSGKSKIAYFCRVTGKYKGTIHKTCECKSFKIPVVFHNLRGYDSHLILRQARVTKSTINIIPTNMEKYMSFSLGRQLVFIDSFQFMAFSLEKLVKNLTTNDFKHTSTRWQGEDLKLVKQKGVFHMST
jgi:hypothetical protein